MFDTIIVQPIFNLLLVIYGLVPGGDFGISVILFAVIVRVLMWPLVKKQLHQTKLMRQLQPDIQKIKAKTKGNKQLEAQLMMELYRERGVNPFSSLGLLVVQLPIFIALFMVIRIVSTEQGRIADFAYSWTEKLPAVQKIITDPSRFDESLLGMIDLTRQAVSSSTIYVPLVALALLSAYLQYYQSKQLSPAVTSNKRLRDIFRDSAKGQQVDQSEVSALMMQRMILFFPVIAFFVALYFPGALVLFYVVSSGVAIIQQRMILADNSQEMSQSVSTSKNETKKPNKPSKATGSASKRASAAKEAETVAVTADNAETSRKKKGKSTKSTAKSKPTQRGRRQSKTSTKTN